MTTPADDREERLWLERLSVGEEQAFVEVYDCFGPRLYRTAVRLLGRGPDAEDVVQELFVALVRSRARLRDTRSLGAYLFVSLRRLIGRSIERNQKAPRLLADGVEWAAAKSEFNTGLAREELDAALGRLPSEQREVVALHLDGELTFAEIAAVLGINANTVASRYRYALDKLRDLLADDDRPTRPPENRDRRANRE